RPYRIIDPILYLAASSLDRHRLIKWPMQWLPSYPLKDCECGATAAPREHYAICPLLQPMRHELLEAFGTIPELRKEEQDIDYILNSLPRSNTGLTRGKWKTTWPALLYVLRKIDRLSHPNEDYDDDEPASEEALQGSTSELTRNHT
ncbi:hypothetical protein BJV82DRAFT_506341, partial [Fennellomyces sp. T-0311]